MEIAIAASALETLNRPGIVMENSPLYFGERTVKYSPSARFSTRSQKTVSLAWLPKVMSSQPPDLAWATVSAAWSASVLTQPTRQLSKSFSFEA